MTIIDTIKRRCGASNLEVRVAMKLGEFDGYAFQHSPTNAQMNKESRYVARACTIITLVHTMDESRAKELEGK